MEPIFGPLKREDGTTGFCSVCKGAYLLPLLRQFDGKYLCPNCAMDRQESRPFFIVGHYYDNNQPFTCPTSAGSPLAAAGAAVRSMLDVNEWDEDRANDVLIVAVLGVDAKGNIGVALVLPEVMPGGEFLKDSTGSAGPDILASIPAN